MGRTRRAGRKTRPHGGGVVTIDLESGKNFPPFLLYQVMFINFYFSFLLLMSVVFHELYEKLVFCCLDYHGFAICALLSHPQH